MNKMYIATLAFLILIVACADKTPAPTATAIRNVTVIDAINGSRANQTVIFDNDKIIAVQDAAQEVQAKTMPALFLSYGITIVAVVSKGQWLDVSNLIDDLEKPPKVN